MTKLEVFTHSWTTKMKTAFCHIWSIPILPTLSSKEKTIQADKYQQEMLSCGIQHQYFGHLTTTGVVAASARSLMMIMSLMVILTNDHCQAGSESSCSTAQDHPRPVHVSCLCLSVLPYSRCYIRGMFIPVCPGKKQRGKYDSFPPPPV